MAKIESGVRQSIDAKEIAVLADVFGITPTELMEADTEDGEPVAANADPATDRRALGRALRLARGKAGFTQQHAAVELGCTQSKINKLENTLAYISPNDLEQLIMLYAIPSDKANKMRRLVERDNGMRQVSDAPPVMDTAGSHGNSAYERMLELEQRADEIRSLHSERIPALLQAETYLLTQHQQAGTPVDPTYLLLQQRERARVLAGLPPTRYRAVLSESSLYRMPGGRRSDMVIGQAEHLIQLGEIYENLSVHILTFDADIPYFPFDFTILKFDDQERDVVYLEQGLEGRLLKSARTVAEHGRHWDRLHAAALDADDSRKFLRDLIQHMGSKTSNAK